MREISRVSWGKVWAMQIFLLSSSVIGAKQEAKSSDALISTGIEDSVKTKVFAADSGSTKQEASITGTRSGVFYKIKQTTFDSTCRYEISGNAKWMHNPKSRRGEWTDPPPYARFLGRNKGCVVDIREGEKWMTFSTSNCVSDKGCPTSSIRPLRLV